MQPDRGVEGIKEVAVPTHWAEASTVEEVAVAKEVPEPVSTILNL